MPAVLCGLDCFEVPSLLTADAVAREFSASLDPSLDGAAGAVEVYRLERVSPDVQLGPHEAVVCRVPGWAFDFLALEELHRQLEELRNDNDNLNIQYSRIKEALMSLNASAEASEATETIKKFPGDGRDNRKELQQLRLQLAQSEKKQQETKATVMALRSEFMHLVDMMSDSGAAIGEGKYPIELPFVMKEHARSPGDDSDKFGSGGLCSREATDCGKPVRHVSQLPVALGARRPIGSPRAYRAPGVFATPRPGARPRAVHQRTGHSAGARQWQVGEVPR